MKSNGFTLIELLVSMGILLVLLAITAINITRLPSSAAQSSSYDLLVSDIRSQQTKAMSGFASSSFGIHFEVTSYTLFQGTTYSPGDSSNFVVNLDPNLSFSGSLFPTDPSGSHVVFTSGSGDVAAYIAGNDSIEIKNNATGDVKTLRINKYGATY